MFDPVRVCEILNDEGVEESLREQLGSTDT
jgi:hypothetical protein